MLKRRVVRPKSSSPHKNKGRYRINRDREYLFEGERISSHCATTAACQCCTVNGISGVKSHIGYIVSAKNSTRLPPKVSVSGFSTTDNVETCALDSGACEAVLSPHAFSNTRTIKGPCTGTKYLACGGERVTNLGEKHVAATDSEGNTFKMTFQCTDKVTRNLAAAQHRKFASPVKESGLDLGPIIERTLFISLIVLRLVMVQRLGEAHKHDFY